MGAADPLYQYLSVKCNTWRPFISDLILIWFRSPIDLSPQPANKRPLLMDTPYRFINYNIWGAPRRSSPVHCWTVERFDRCAAGIINDTPPQGHYRWEDLGNMDKTSKIRRHISRKCRWSYASSVAKLRFPGPATEEELFYWFYAPPPPETLLTLS